jgi:hypothetical protein
MLHNSGPKMEATFWFVAAEMDCSTYGDWRKWRGNLHLGWHFSLYGRFDRFRTALLSADTGCLFDLVADLDRRSDIMWKICSKRDCQPRVGHEDID